MIVDEIHPAVTILNNTEHKIGTPWPLKSTFGLVSGGGVKLFPLSHVNPLIIIIISFPFVVPRIFH